MGRKYPRTGETWQHYCGQECFILGVLNNGSRDTNIPTIVAYELVNATRDRFFRTIEEFMGQFIDERGKIVNRFELVPEDISAEIWERSFSIK